MTIDRTTLIKACRIFLVLILIHRPPVVVADGLSLSGRGDSGSNWKLTQQFVLPVQVPDFYAPTLDFTGTYYFEPPGHTSGPYAERDFLNPVRALSVRTLYEKSIGIDEFSGYHLGFDSSFKKGNHIYKPGAQITDFAGQKTYGAGMEYAFLLTETSRVFGNINLSHEQLASGDALSGKANIGYKKLWTYGSGRALATEFGLEYIRSENESVDFSILKYNVDVDYYFIPRWGVGLNLNQSSSPLKRFISHGLGISTSFHFNPDFGLNFSAGVTVNEEQTLSGLVGLAVVIRF